MSTANLRNLNVDTLFEQHSVPEIDIIQKKIQGVVEQKREELRTMVGERYRDLLQAADTIASMQTSAATLIKEIDHISVNCRSLNEKQLIGFQNTNTADQIHQRNTNKELNNYFSTMVQMKLLTSLPEMIWSRIDYEHFYAATELFTFSRHISTGLQLDSNNELMQHLPLAKRQWETLKPFHMTIKQCVVKVLESEDLNAETAADCLLSLLLLEKSNFNAIVRTFLQLRCSAFRGCFSDSATGGDDIGMRRIKERILASLKVLNGTMQLLGKCLLENGLVWQKLDELKDTRNPPTIALMEESKYSHLLPEIIANFRPKFDVQSLDKEQVSKAIEQWLADTKRIGAVHLKNLFDLVPNMSTIQEIKHKAKEFKKELDLETIVSYCNLKESLDFYEKEYVPLINQRIRDIIENSWKQAIKTMLDSIERVLNDEDLIDINIWQEHPTDLPGSLQIALNDERNTNKLLMKIRGYDSKIIQHSKLFDEQIAAIITEMNILLGEPMTKSDDKLELVEFLRETSQNQLNELLTKLKAHNLSKSKRKELLFVARSCGAIVELCPHLKTCFCQQANWRQWMGTSAQLASTSYDHWQRISLLIEDETQRFWDQALDGILDECNCSMQMPGKLTHEVLLEDFVHWESLSLDQKDEDDNVVTSTLRIPSQPRISLQTYLFSIVSLLNASIPQTLPLKVLQNFNQKLLSQLLAHYEKLSSDESLSNNQYIALQLYFDLKFLQSIFKISREDRPLNEQFQTLQSTYKNFVDPFDFELFAEHISGNVKRAVTRSNCQLGVLVRSGTSIGSNSVVPLSQERDPNVLSLSTSSPTSVWFPLLPIVTKTIESKAVAPVEDQQPTTSPSGRTTPRKSSSRKSNEANPKAKTTGATSFFGAMSQEWFR